MLVRFCHTFVLTSFILSATISNSFAAKIYHWVDEKGQAHYSETPPRNISSKKLDVRATGTGTVKDSVSSISSAAKKKSDQVKSEKEVDNQHTAEEKALYCQQSRNLMQSMNGNTQRRFEQPDGSFRKITEAEIADNRSQAQAGIEAYCQ
jgi:hypothetical protein